jgi:uncharacterized protein with von Willebrand factor type A (vWA) domain
MAMDFANASGRVRKLLAPTRPQDLQKSALTEDKLRDNIIRDQELANPRFQHAIKKQPEISYEDKDGEQQSFTWDTYEEAGRDFARAAFGWDEPECARTDAVRPSYRFNREAINAAIHTDAMRELRPYSRGNAVEATYGAMAYADKLQEIAAESCADILDHTEQLAEAEQEAQSADDALESLRNLAKQENEEHGTVQPGTRKDIKGALKGIDAAQQKIDELIANGPPNVLARAIEAGREAAEEANEAVQAISNIPGMEPGQTQHMDPETQMKLAERWSAAEGLRKMARRFGRKVRSFQFKRNARTQHVPMQPVGIETGDAFERLLPLELARATSEHPAMRVQFISELEDRSLLQFKKDGETPAGKGPVVPVEDGSGSMGLRLGELTRQEWAKVMNLILLKLCQNEKRHFASVQFGSTSQLKSWEFPPHEPPDPERVLDFATHFFNGGTDTETGLREALRIVKEQPEFKTADVVLIADGDDTFQAGDKQVCDELRDLGVRIHGINVGSKNNPYLTAACDDVVHIVDLANDEENVLDSLAENIT